MGLKTKIIFALLIIIIITSLTTAGILTNRDDAIQDKIDEDNKRDIFTNSLNITSKLKNVDCKILDKDGKEECKICFNINIFNNKNNFTFNEDKCKIFPSEYKNNNTFLKLHFEEIIEKYKIKKVNDLYPERIINYEEDIKEEINIER
jgi:hypothetical protein